MERLLEPGVNVLVCQSVALRRWGERSSNFRAPFWRLYRNHQSGAAVLFGGQTIELSARYIYLIPPETDFWPDLRSPVRHFYAHFIARPPFDRAAPGIYGIEAGPDHLRGIAILESLMESPDTPLLAARFAMRVMALIHHALSELPDTALILRPADDRINRALAAIRENLRTPWSNPRLAEVARMTPNAFIRRFREVVGESPQRYARRQRVEKACVLLHATHDSIEQIADATGFCDRYHFTRVFTRLRGAGPAAFRKTVAASWAT